MKNHEQDTVPVTVHLTEFEFQAAVELGIKAALNPHDQVENSLPFTSMSNKASGVFINQWRGKAQW